MSTRRSRLASLRPVAVVVSVLAASVFASDTAPASPPVAVAAPPPAPPAPPDPLPAAPVDTNETTRLAEVARLDREARAPAADVKVAPSSRGVFGAWLVAGPFRAGRLALDVAPASVDEKKLASPLSGAVASGDRDVGTAKRRPPARWMIASSNEGAIDLKAALETPTDKVPSESVSYAAGTLHLEAAARVLVLLGVDDGVRLSVDGKVVLARDEGRPVREDDDVVPLDLAAGDHPLLLKLHQRDGAWAFRVRVVDASSLAPLAGSYLALPGTSVEDARTLAAKMSWVSLERAFDPVGESPRYRPRLTVRYSEGAPRGVPLAVSVKLLPSASETPVFDLQAGGVPISSAGVSELVVTLPTIAPSADTLGFETTVAGRVVKAPLPSRPLTEQALAHAAHALFVTPQTAAFLTPGAYDSVTYLVRRLGNLLARGDADVEAQNDEARELDRMASAMERGADPFEGRTGAMRRALRDPLDGDFSELGVYVPPGYKDGGTRKFPLVVGLHGMNGYALGIMRWLFGGDDPKHDQSWEDRHVGTLPPFGGFVITPQGHGNSLYRELGEVDIMNAVAWAMKRYPIDPARVTITGPSMGGIGAAAIPLHHPHVFAAAAPLCGYHSFFIRSDVSGRGLRPWEKYLAEERSNVFWAENGEHLPLWIVHGTKDLPEENSGVLIDRYEKLNFSVKHEHPDAGHNVWQQTYEENKGLDWLAWHKLDLHPSHVRFKTTRTRFASSAWVEVDELASESTWGEIDARAKSRARTITASTSGVAQLTFKRDEQLFGDAAVTVTIDNQTLSFDEGEALVVGRKDKMWSKGPLAHTGPFKHGTVTGPIRDVFSEPILFVYAGGEEASANEEVARHFAKIRYGVSVAYPVMSDFEFAAKGELVANDRALFLIGRQNKVLEALERTGQLPIHIESGAVTLGAERFTGRELGAGFIRPNPTRPDRYVVVMAGADAPGMLRAMSMPDLLPDFVVWDAAVAPSRGAILLGAGSLRAGGFFDKEWGLPGKTADPLARARRAGGTADAAGAPSADE